MKVALGCFLVLLTVSGCRRDMYDQPKTKLFSKTEFFADQSSARPLPAHTVVYHGARVDEARFTGLTKGILVAQLPVKLTPDLLERGRERYEIYCAICHGASGDGQGQVVRRGFPAPPSYHQERLRQAPIGHFYDVITNGYGAMYSYAARVNPDDRWAIAAYIRALQLSQNTPRNQLEPEDLKKLESH